MIKRLITGAVLIILLIPVFIYSDTIILPIVFSAITAVTLYEVAVCCKAADKKHLPLAIPVYIIGAALPLIEYLTRTEAAASSAVMYPHLPEILLTAAFLMIFVIYAGGVFGYVKFSMSPAAQLLTMLIYAGGSAVAAVAISSSDNGKLLLPLIFIGSWGTDTFAYLSGRLFGRHKLIPSVSPHKTIEGSVGGSLCCAALFALYGAIISSVTELTANYTALILTGLFISVISQIGDLNASYIKRVHKIKDFGNIFPGHGGMFDRFDSLIAVVPFIFVFILAISYFI